MVIHSLPKNFHPAQGLTCFGWKSLPTFAHLPELRAWAKQLDNLENAVSPRNSASEARSFSHPLSASVQINKLQLHLFAIHPINHHTIIHAPSALMMPLASICHSHCKTSNYIDVHLKQTHQTQPVVWKSVEPAMLQCQDAPAQPTDDLLSCLTLAKLQNSYCETNTSARLQSLKGGKNTQAEHVWRTIWRIYLKI